MPQKRVYLYIPFKDKEKARLLGAMWNDKSKQKEIKSIFDRNIETLSKDYQKEYKIFEYKGLLISGEKTSLNTLSFYISTLDGKIFVEPENLVYK